MQLLLQNNQCAFVAQPGNDQLREFLFCVPLKKESSATSEGKRWGVAALLTGVEGGSSTEGQQLMLSFIAWIRGSLLQSACGRCQ